MKKVFLLLLVFMIGCAKEVSRQYDPPHEEVRTLDCTHSDFCFTCMPGFTGKMDCGFKLSPYCPGNRKARVQVTPYRVHYDDGSVSLREQVVEIQEVEACH